MTAAPEKANLVWSDTVRTSDHMAAVAQCQTLKGRLATADELAQVEREGAYEVLPNMQDQWIWTSPVEPLSDALFADVYSTKSGQLSSEHRDRPNAVRCVTDAEEDVYEEAAPAAAEPAPAVEPIPAAEPAPATNTCGK